MSDIAQMDAKELLEPKGTSRRKRVDPELARSRILKALSHGRYLTTGELYHVFSAGIRKIDLHSALISLEQQGLISGAQMRPPKGRPAVVWKALT